MNEETESECPVVHAAGGTSNRDWWPNQLDLSVLHANSPKGDPMGEDFDYAEAFTSLDLAAVKRDIGEVMTTSQDWWPADYGHYGPLFIRMAWHSAGTYRISDGRGGAGTGQQRFAPLNSWPDNGNLDKARRLLWPVKKKYGSDALVGRPHGPGRQLRPGVDGLRRPSASAAVVRTSGSPRQVNWGSEAEWLGDARYSGDRELENPLGAVQMGLIYVNPEGPNGNPDPLAAARDIRETFARMAMNDEETVALIAGGHTFGKTHGAADPNEYVGREPEAAPLAGAGPRLEEQLRHRATATPRSPAASRAPGRRLPTTWDNSFFETLFRYEWDAVEEPRRRVAVDPDGPGGGRHRAPTRTTRRRRTRR